MLQLDRIKDAFNVGGYLDTQTLNYIAPKWLHDTNPTYYKGLTSAQYEVIWDSKDRYLKLPTIRSVALRCAMALQLGITEDELIKAGLPKGISQSVMWNDNVDIDSGSPNYTNEEFDLLSAISCILMGTRKMDACFDMEDKFFADMMLKWLAEYNIELEVGDVHCCGS